MKTSLWSSLVAGVRNLLARLWGRHQRSLLLPESVDELLEVTSCCP